MKTGKQVKVCKKTVGGSKKTFAKQTNVTRKAGGAKQRGTSNKARIDLYNFETSEECIKLEFSIGKENYSPVVNTKSAVKRSRGRSNDVSFSGEKPTKRSKMEICHKASPAFEFFSTKKKKVRLSDSGVFMTPSPVLDQGTGKKEVSTTKAKNSTPLRTGARRSRNYSQDAEKENRTLIKNAAANLKMQSKNSTVEKLIAKGKSPNVQSENVDESKGEDGEERVKKPTRAKTVRVEKNVVGKGKRASRRLAARQDEQKNSKIASIKDKKQDSKSKLRNAAEKSTSTPSMPLRSRSKQAKKTFEVESLVSPPEVSPVQKVGTEHGNMFKSPTDFGGSPSFRMTRCSVVLQDSLVHAKTVKEKNASSRETKSTGDVKSPPEVGVGSPQEYNSLMDESMFDVQSPVKSPPLANQSKQTRGRETGKKAERSWRSDDKSSDIGHERTPEPTEQGKPAGSSASGSYSTIKSKSIKKKGRYSTSRLDAWALQMNSEFDDIESYELSID